MYTFVDRGSGELLRSLYGPEFLIRDYMPQALPDDERLQLPMWDALGLRFLFATRPMRHAGVQVGPHLVGSDPDQQFLVYERRSALPRAWVVPALHEVADGPAAVAAVTAPGFAPRASAIVTAADRTSLGDTPAGEAAAAERRVSFVFENARRLTLQVTAGARGYLVLADSFFSGWSVEVDGKPAPLARANVCQRVVPLPAEGCTVQFRFATPGLKPGLALAGLGVLFAAVLIVLGVRAGRAAHGGAFAPPPMAT
jgi:hypothetical protein